MVSRYTGLLSALNGTVEPFSTEWASINLRHPLCEEMADFKEWRRFHSVIPLCIVSSAAMKPHFLNVQKALTRSAVCACMLQLTNPVTRYNLL